MLDSRRDRLAHAGSHVDLVTVADLGETVLACDPTPAGPLSPMLVEQDRGAQGVRRARGPP